MVSPFEVLGVDEDADDGEVVAAYRRRVKETHPDQGGSSAEFQRVREAYDAITSGDGEWEKTDDRTTAARPGGTAGGTDAADEAEPDEPVGSTVQYLNYDVLDDHGWSLDDDDLFEKAAGADLSPEDWGEITVEPDETLLEAAEDSGFVWPYSCRGGACANCAVSIVEGDLSTPVNHILPEEMIDRDIRLSCVGTPTTDEAKVVFNVKHLPDLDELRLPPRQFRGNARS